MSDEILKDAIRTAIDNHYKKIIWKRTALVLVCAVIILSVMMMIRWGL